MKGMKGTASHAVKLLMNWEGCVWEPESFDRVIRRGKEGDAMEYVVENPVRAGLVTRAEDYLWTWTAQTGMSALHGLPR